MSTASRSDVIMKDDRAGTGETDTTLRAREPHRDQPRTMSTFNFADAWCAIGGERGGDVVPRWFAALPDLGVLKAHLFWSLPESGYADLALDQLRSVSARWLAELKAEGVDGELSIKRGAPGPWLTALSELSPSSLLVTGPPAWRGTRSSTITHLLETARRPLLLLPDLVQPPEVHLLSRPVVDTGDGSVNLDGLPSAERVDLSAFGAAEASRIALRVAEDVDASLIILPYRASELAPIALERGNFPILVPGP
jgi:hypothetical protein